MLEIALLYLIPFLSIGSGLTYKYFPKIKFQYKKIRGYKPLDIDEKEEYRKNILQKKKKDIGRRKSL